ncbi:MAG: HDIG domain-containing protein [candidate division KSB1 bacterium]|nr:HDIG domain-containing protein [candidate division KSB1 bacterium]MDZ7341041.1 HDIG domain-containing protein [candidate division KSB1 bacterium]
MLKSKLIQSIDATLKRMFSLGKLKDKEGPFGVVQSPYFGPIVIGLILVVIISLMLPRGKSYQFGDLKEKEVYVGEEIIAPFTFAINKTPEEYKRDLLQAEKAVLPVFNRSDSIAQSYLNAMRTFFDSLETIKSRNSKFSAQTRTVTRLLEQHGVQFLDEKILRIVNGQSYQNFKELLFRIARDVYAAGILNLTARDIKAVDGKISIATANAKLIHELQSVYDLQQAREAILTKLRSHIADDEFRTAIGYQLLLAFVKPNILYDAQETQRLIIEARNSVPLAKGTVLEKERIIDRYERITREHIEKLQSLAAELAEREVGKSILLELIRFLSKLLLISLILAVFVIFVAIHRRKILTNIGRVILLAMIFFLVTFLSYLIIHFGLSPYLIPIAIGSMLLTIFFDARIGFVGTVVLSILIGCLRGNEFNVALVSIFTGTMAVLSVRRIRSRKWFFNSIMIVTAAYGVSILVMELLHYSSFQTVARSLGYGAINGFLSPLMVYGLQVIFEYFFDIVTDMRLLELSDLNNPLLRKLALEAPGTYHHSLMVGSLAEAAAERIGANSLLTRVGAYYHDIGKIEKREYFIENQIHMKNPHEKLSPNMSCLILINHVKKGLELARHYKLPQEIRAFIAEHHGTNLISFFYQKAKEKGNDEEVDESVFRYPGPRPKSKETGLVMLADAVEAATRSLKDPSASRLRGMIVSIVHERFISSELDECPLTLRDLTNIIDSFQTILLGIFHTRIEYPEQEEKLAAVTNKRKREKSVNLQN